MGYIRKSNPIIQAVRAVDSNEIDIYKPTKLKVARWFNLLNEHVFWAELPKFKRVIIKKLPDDWAYTSIDYYSKDQPFYELYLNNKFPNRTDFIETLAHEMVHTYQYIFFDKAHHGQSFFEWKNRFKKFELNLTKEGKYRFRNLF